jgi:hypothetical protein
LDSMVVCAFFGSEIFYPITACVVVPRVNVGGFTTKEWKMRALCVGKALCRLYFVVIKKISLTPRFHELWTRGIKKKNTSVFLKYLGLNSFRKYSSQPFKVQWLIQEITLKIQSQCLRQFQTKTPKMAVRFFIVAISTTNI